MVIIVHWSSSSQNNNTLSIVHISASSPFIVVRCEVTPKVVQLQYDLNMKIIFICWSCMCYVPIYLLTLTIFHRFVILSVLTRLYTFV